MPPRSGSSTSPGGVTAYKFRDPDGHPLELLQFPAGKAPVAWRGSVAAGQIGLGIDHSAVSVADVDASTEFYRALGLTPGKRTLNQGSAQQNLDGLRDVRVTVAPMRPARGTPHLELLGYSIPRGCGGLNLAPNDTAATRILWRGSRAVLLRDLDGHLHQIEPS
jgi:catechol 2,3-dioxygenase-like lactoylglutathione lyase family enzyme